MSMNVKKLGAAAVAVLAFVLAGPVLYAAPATIEHMHCSCHGEPIRLATEEIVALFNEIQDDVRVETTFASGVYVEQVITRVAGGTAPDVLISHRLGELAPRGLVLRLNEFLERDGLSGVFVPVGLTHSTWNGELIQIPLSVEPFVTYYNVYLFEEAGLETPDSLDARSAWDRESLAEAATKIARDTTGDGVLDVWGAGSPMPNMARGVFWLSLAGGYFFDRAVNPQASRFDAPEVAAGLSYVHSLIHERRATEVDAFVSGLGVQRFQEGSVGLNFDGPWRIGSFRSVSMPAESWEIAWVPQGVAGRPSIVNTTGVQIAAASANPDAAWAWVRFMATDPRAIRIFTHRTGRPPAVIEHVHGYVDQITIDGRPRGASVVVDALIAAGDTSYPVIPLVPYFEQYNAIHGPEVSRYLSGEQDLGATQERVHSQFSRLLRSGLQQ